MSDQGLAAQGSDSADVRTLREARAKLTIGWILGADPRDAAGRLVDPTDPRAAQWCAIGASHSTGRCVCDLVTAEIGREVGSLGDWNDEPDRTKADVLRAFDRAIASAEAEGRSDPKGPSASPAATTDGRGNAEG